MFACLHIFKDSVFSTNHHRRHSLIGSGKLGLMSGVHKKIIISLDRKKSIQSYELTDPTRNYLPTPGLILSLKVNLREETGTKHCSKV